LNSFRIIGGHHKGKRVFAPENLPVRPTTDQAKEALFNILVNKFYFPEIKVLDLFSGTGNISYEFLSRGVEAITAVEQNLNCVRFIRKTAAKLTNLPLELINKDVFRYLNNCDHCFDCIFADPPYDLQRMNEIADIVFQKKLLKPGGWLVIEHSSRTNFNDHAAFLEMRKYGHVHFSFLKER
jgi:16S rRNA (guanine(966)-N(2))-methyltransferase RsmD